MSSGNDGFVIVSWKVHSCGVRMSLFKEEELQTKIIEKDIDSRMLLFCRQLLAFFWSYHTALLMGNINIFSSMLKPGTALASNIQKHS